MSKAKEEFMLYVFEDPDYPKSDPHAVAKVRCMHCNSKYVIVVPKPEEHKPFECPECHRETKWRVARLKGEIRS